MARNKKWEIARAAGFFEGEGSCIVCKKGGLQVAAYQSGNQWPLLELQRLFGGTVREYAIRPPRPTFTPRKPHGQWTIYGPNAATFLTAVLPFLSPLKAVNIDRGLKQWQQYKNGNNKNGGNAK
jgi:hypothetical protein